MMWFGTSFDRATHQRVLVEALRRRDVIGVRVVLDRAGGLGTDTRDIRGRDKLAAARRSEAFRSFLEVHDELLCTDHKQGRYLQCDACLCWFRDGQHAAGCCHSTTSPELCPIRSYREVELPEGRVEIVAALPGTLPHRPRPVRCEGCRQVHRADLDDLRAELHATRRTATSGAAA